MVGGLATDAIGLSFLARPLELGTLAVIPTVTVPQGAVLKCLFTFKNTGYVRTGFQAKFWVISAVGSNAWSLPVPGITLDPGALTTTQTILGSVRPDTPIGTATVKLDVTDVLADGTPGNTIYASASGTINVVSGVAAEIITVTVEPG